MADKIREWTDAQLNKMERRISNIYRKASKGIYKSWNDFMKETNKKTSDLQEKYNEAKKSGDQDAIRQTGRQLAQYKKEVTLYDDQYKDMIRETTEQMANVNKTALAYVNDQMPSIYANNFNDMKVDADALGIDFGVVNEATVKRLIADEDLSLLRKRLDIPKDMRWNRKQLNSAVLQGILQGESMDEIAKRIVHITDNNKNSAIRNARTMVTCAENRGRLDSAKELENQGAVMSKVWEATGDSRTRDLHLYLDGQEVELDKPFIDDNGNKIDYPGDPTAAAETVYNCRCSMKRHVIGFRKKDGRIEYVNYDRGKELSFHDNEIIAERQKRSK